MIDFRYHLVSLASVLIALAIGIVLGAGPLKEGISQSLSDQVSALREEKATLRAELDAAAKSNADHTRFEDSSLAALVSGRLADRSIAVISFPGAQTALVSRTEDTLGAAGARLLAPIQIEEEWADPSEDAVADRAALASELGVSLGLTREGESGPSLGAVLAAVVGGHAPVEGAQPPAGPSPQARAAAWSRLQEAGLVSGDFTDTAATLVVAVAAPQTEVVTSPVGPSALAAYADLALSLDTATDGVVIVGAIDPEVASTESVISAARAESQIRQRVSTVDNAGTAIGQASAVYGLIEQGRGGAGQYGALTGARSLFPAIG